MYAGFSQCKKSFLLGSNVVSKEDLKTLKEININLLNLMH